MFFDAPMILHSTQPDGRHWLTSLDLPPMQILPVAPNHCRAGHFLATLVSGKLRQLDGAIPDRLTLSRADVAANSTLAGRYPELKSEAGEVEVELLAKPAAVGAEDDAEADDDDGMFVTPQPPSGWKGDYDSWIVTIGRRLGVDVEAPCGTDGYETAMLAAAKSVQEKLPVLRERFLSGMEGLNLGFKFALTTRKGGQEYVWMRPTGWPDASTLVGVLESQPRDCQKYKQGQTIEVPCRDLLDYCIGSETAGIVDPGLTQRVAEDYGLVIS